MTTLGDLIERVRRELLPSGGEALNKLAATVGSSTSPWTFTYDLGGIQDGATLSCDFETVRVWPGANATAKTAPVERGYLGSTAAAHTSGALVRVKPDVTDAQILDAINDVLDELPRRGLFREATKDITTVGTGARSYDFVTDALKGDPLLDVRYDASGIANEWPTVKGAQVLPNMSTAVFSTGNAIRLNSHVEEGVTMRVWYKGLFTRMTADRTLNVATASGLPDPAHDILPLGACLRLAAWDEIPRNRTQSQGDTRRAQEVPPGAKLRAPLRIQADFDRRVKQEILLLKTRWPDRTSP